ncbi:DUF6233 domain-containing protein [Streptomyces sp. NBC_00289]|uniref:DUF6233 domain-containing protein n=1 Tax=Streptomyces sp. NBC_00289 TaxID=2975703 RepID=UPI003245F995
MFDDLPPDLDRLHTLRIWHTLWLSRINAKIATLEQRQAETEHGRESRPAKPEWIVELGISTGRPPVQVHAGDCHMAGTRRRPVGRDEARRLLATGVGACIHCQPDTQLHILDLCGRPLAFPRRGPRPTSLVHARQPGTHRATAGRASQHETSF